MARVAAVATCVLLFAMPALAQDRRPITIHDVYAIRAVADPAIAPDGAWVAYTVTTTASAKDRQQSDIWVTSWDGTHTAPVTNGEGSNHLPRYSPDGRWLAFLSSRGDSGEKSDVDQV